MVLTSAPSTPRGAIAHKVLLPSNFQFQIQSRGRTEAEQRQRNGRVEKKQQQSSGRAAAE